MLFAACAGLSAGGCGGGGSSGSVGAPPHTVPTPTPTPLTTPTPIPTPAGPEHLPTHVVVIVQENRTVDNLFNGFPGADTVRSGLDSLGQTRQLARVPLDATFDVGHSYRAFVAEY